MDRLNMAKSDAVSNFNIAQERTRDLERRMEKFLEIIDRLSKAMNVPSETLIGDSGLTSLPTLPKYKKIPVILLPELPQESNFENIDIDIDMEEDDEIDIDEEIDIDINDFEEVMEMGMSGLAAAVNTSLKSKESGLVSFSPETLIDIDHLEDDGSFVMVEDAPEQPDQLDDGSEIIIELDDLEDLPPMMDSDPKTFADLEDAEDLIEIDDDYAQPIGDLEGGFPELIEIEEPDPSKALPEGLEEDLRLLEATELEELDATEKPETDAGDREASADDTVFDKDRSES
jgi:hypothetical protein